MRGPTVDRDGPTRAVRAGRAICKRRAVVNGVVLADGTRVTDCRDAAQALLDTRRPIWFVASPAPGDTIGLLAAYMAERPDGSVPELPLSLPAW